MMYMIADTIAKAYQSSFVSLFRVGLNKRIYIAYVNYITTNHIQSVMAREEEKASKRAKQAHS